MAEANVCQRVHAVFVKNKAYLRGVIKVGLSSFLDNQEFLTETEKLAAQDVSIDENKRLGDLMEIIEKRISKNSDFFSTVLSCLKDNRYTHNLDNIKKEIEEARETALSAHSSISGSGNASFDGSIIPQPITRRQSTGDILFHDLPTTSQILSSHQKGVRKRPSSASEKYLSPYASSGSSKKVSTPSRPGSGQRKQGDTPNVSPVHRPQSSGSSASPLESPMSPMSPMSLSGSFIMDTTIESPAVQKKTWESSLAGDDSVFFEDSEVECQQPVEQQMSQNEEEHTRHGITAEDKEALLLNKLEKVNDSVEKTRTELVIGSHVTCDSVEKTHTELVIGSHVTCDSVEKTRTELVIGSYVTCSHNVYKNARQECSIRLGERMAANWKYEVLPSVALQIRYEALHTRFDRLVSVMAANVEVVASKAFTANLISKENLSDALNGHINEATRTIKLLQRILTKVEEKDSTFDSFVAILKSVPVLKGLAGELNEAVGIQESDSECDDEEVSVGTKRKHPSHQPTGSGKEEVLATNESTIESSFDILVEEVTNMLPDEKKDEFQHLRKKHRSRSQSISELFRYLQNICKKRLYYDAYPKLRQMIDKFEEEELRGYFATIRIVAYIDDCKRKHEEIAEHSDQSPSVDDDCKQTLTIHLEVRITDQTLEYIEDIWRRVARVFVLPRLSAVLEVITYGSIRITWRITDEAAYKIRDKANTKSAIKFFKEEHITQVMIDDECVYEEKEDESGMAAKMKSEPATTSESQVAEEKEPKAKSMIASEEDQDQPYVFGEEIINSMRQIEKLAPDIIKMMKDAREMVTKPFVQFSQWAQRKTLDLVKACRYNSEIEVVKKFLERKDVNVNMREKSDKYAWTPIMWSAENGNFDVVNLLIERGADVNAKSEENDWTSLIIASRRGHMKIVQLLLDHGAVVDAQTNDQSTALTWALYEGHTEVANLLIKKGANVNNEEENGWTPIIRASNKGLVEMVKPLLDRGAEVNHQANRGWTALMAATNKKHKEVVDALFDHEDEQKRADPNLAMEDTLEIALHIACYMGYTDIAISLFKAGSNTGARNKDGETPLMVATKRGYRNTRDTLVRLQAGQDLDQPLELFESSVDA